MEHKNNNFFLIMPSYKSSGQIINVIKKVNFEIIDLLIVVDDFCPENTGLKVKNFFKKNNKVMVIFNKKNLGVGGATKVGIKNAIKLGASHIIKIDSDGQMNPSKINDFIKIANLNKYDYIKGNRFLKRDFYKKMPFVRLFGNLILSLISKISSGYYFISDPTNGFILITKKAATQIDYLSVNDGFFFESDIINKLWYEKHVIFEIPLETSYGNEKSNLKIYKILLLCIYI